MAKAETLRCDECNRALVNRLIDKCLYCGAEISAEMLLTEAEKSLLREKEMKSIAAERDARLKREKEREENSLGSGSSTPFVTSYGLFGLF